MGLHAVLTVLSDAIQKDASAEEVAALIDAADLSPCEREDLRAIPYARLIPYQSDLYYADRNMLAWGFSNTWHCLRQLRFGMDFPGAERDFVVRFKTLHPSPSHSVRELGALFVRYLSQDCAILCSARPWLLDIAEAERLETEVLYAVDNPIGKALDSTARDAFFAQDLDAVLSTKVVRAEQVCIRPWRYSFPEIKAAVSESEDRGEPMGFDAPAFHPLSAPRYYGIARDHETLAPVWYHAGEIDARCLDAVTEDAPRMLEDIAGAILPCLSDNDETEEVLLARFLQWIDRALRLRYLLIA